MTMMLSMASLMPAHAQEEELSQEHLDRIKASCTSAQHKIGQLHANDALLRVNRGQMYEAISVKLMTTMNSRIALNRLDGGGLVDTTAAYDQELAAFRVSYRVYEKQLSAAMRIDCHESPAEFYEATQTASESRKIVHDRVVKLHEYIKQYQKEFDKFHHNFKNNSKQEAEA